MKQRAEFEHARELGKALAGSAELIRLRNAQAELELDKDAEEDFNGLLKTINGIIGFYVTGEETIEIKGRGCSGCKGCNA